MKYCNLLLILTLFACRTPAPTNWAQECADRFPPRTDTVRVTHETVRFDTLTLSAPPIMVQGEVICPPSDTVRLVRYTTAAACPPNVEITRTRTVRDTVIIHAANVAREVQLRRTADSIEAKKKDNDILLTAAHRKVATWRKAAISAWLIILILIAIATRRLWMPRLIRL